MWQQERSSDGTFRQVLQTAQAVRQFCNANLVMQNLERKTVDLQSNEGHKH